MPICQGDIGSCLGSNKVCGQLPIMFQPPGEALG
ncbi:Uncharacterised protein [Vibrio cholerae]|nr:Uncharacterised protein [Vibrio cholerae]